MRSAAITSIVVGSLQLFGRRRRRSAPRRMKGDRITVRILCDEKATEGAIGKGGEDGAPRIRNMGESS